MRWTRETVGLNASPFIHSLIRLTLVVEYREGDHVLLGGCLQSLLYWYIDLLCEDHEYSSSNVNI